MMSGLKVFTLLAALFYSTLFVNAQDAAPWVDPVTSIPFMRYWDQASNVTWGYVFPKSSTTNEFLGIITGPTMFGWLGADLGPTMANNLLLMAWMNGNSPIISPRYITQYGPPPVYSGPKITLLSTTGISGETQRFVYRCQNCTTWTDGRISLGQANKFAFAVSLAKVTTPSDPASGLRKHDSAGVYNINLANANATTSNYDTYIKQLSPPTTSPTGGHSHAISPTGYSGLT